MLRRRIESSLWALGDWLIRGKDWDDKFQRSRKITGYSPSHLHNVRRVAYAFPPLQRSYNLSFAAHLVLLAEVDQDRLMELHAKAVAGAWTVDDVKQHFKTYPPTLKKPRHDPHYQHVRVKCPNCEHVFPIKGNKVV